MTRIPVTPRPLRIDAADTPSTSRNAVPPAVSRFDTEVWAQNPSLPQAALPKIIRVPMRTAYPPEHDRDTRLAMGETTLGRIARTYKTCARVFEREGASQPAASVNEKGIDEVLLVRTTHGYNPVVDGHEVPMPIVGDIEANSRAAFAYASDFPYTRQLIDAYNHGQMGAIRRDPFFMAWLDVAPSNDMDLLKALLGCQADQMSFDAKALGLDIEERVHAGGRFVPGVPVHATAVKDTPARRTVAALARVSSGIPGVPPKRDDDTE